MPGCDACSICISICIPRFSDIKVEARHLIDVIFFRSDRVLGLWYDDSQTKIIFYLAKCLDADWSFSFDRKGWSRCTYDNYFIKALYRSNPHLKENPISSLDKARCCRASGAFQWQDYDCVKTCWKDKPK